MRIAATLTALLIAAAPAGAGEHLPGPVPAAVVRVIDGDTLEVRAQVWLGHYVETRVRLAGVDAPRLAGSAVVLADVRPDKYAGRVVARVLADGRDVAAALIAEGLARPYNGGRRGG